MFVRLATMVLQSWVTFVKLVAIVFMYGNTLRIVSKRFGAVVEKKLGALTD
jgi:hypothetical protein